MARRRPAEYCARREQHTEAKLRKILARRVAHLLALLDDDEEAEMKS
jgi:hypothetical protein